MRLNEYIIRALWSEITNAMTVNTNHPKTINDNPKITKRKGNVYILYCFPIDFIFTHGSSTLVVVFLYKYN